MDLTQGKLNKSEWESIEIPVEPNELKIIHLIRDSYENVNRKTNNSRSLLQIAKILTPDNSHHAYFYEKYFNKIVKEQTRKYSIEYDPKIPSKLKPKKADIIRIENTDKIITENKNDIYEFILLELTHKLCKNHQKKNSKWLNYYYTLYHMKNLSVSEVNIYVLEFITIVLDNFKIQIIDVLKNAKNMIENNEYLSKYSDIELYSHQKRLFTLTKTPSAKLLLYIAPTGTGKTLSPIGLASKHRVIFVCAARHVGLSLAKSAISAQKKIALAFNCNDATDIRLHYYSVKDFVKNKRTGGIFRVDNSVGDKVEIMITDIKSYRYAMYYMIAFNKKEDIITYWDEPTITMDYVNHEYHDVIHENWKENVIPNIVLSSATLPCESDIQPVIMDFRSRFGGEVHSIVSHDCNKSIPIITKKCDIYMPHFNFKEYKELQECAEHCLKHNTLLRYLELGETLKFIVYLNENKLIMKKRYYCETYFESIDMITMKEIKLYYLELLKQLDESSWEKYLKKHTTIPKLHESNIKFITEDAHTLLCGPTIYLAKEIDKIAKFCIQQASIPEKMMEIMKSSLEYNDKINREIAKCDLSIDTLMAKYGDKTDSALRDPIIKRTKQKIEDLKMKIKSFNLNDVYIPNRRAHLEKWASEFNEDHDYAFTCDISDDDVCKIMLLNDIDERWKILLLMGIGVFIEHSSVAYTEIMKRLAEEKKLFMIIASSDYIYGTNYQFYHSYIGKDLSDMTQEKTIQAMGRVGRNNIHQSYSVRFRDDELIKKLFVKEENSIEVENLNRLFTS